MTSPLRRKPLIAAALLVPALLLPVAAQAFPQFHAQFKDLYIKDSENPEWVKLANKAKCLACHQGKSKENLNPYGHQVHELLGPKDKKNVEKIIAALKEVAELHSVTDDEASPTFAERIAEGKLPGGELEELTKDPE
jgi:hypothetical protein